MARPKKVIISDSETSDEPIQENIQTSVIYEDEQIKVDIQSEYDFLIDLLRVQEGGNWHGPAAGLIKERLKLISNG